MSLRRIPPGGVSDPALPSRFRHFLALRPRRRVFSGFGYHLLEGLTRGFYDTLGSCHFDEEISLRAFQDRTAERVTGHRRSRTAGHAAAERSLSRDISDFHGTLLDGFCFPFGIAAGELSEPASDILR